MAYSWTLHTASTYFKPRIAEKVEEPQLLLECFRKLKGDGCRDDHVVVGRSCFCLENRVSTVQPTSFESAHDILHGAIVKVQGKSRCLEAVSCAGRNEDTCFVPVVLGADGRFPVFAQGKLTDQYRTEPKIIVRASLCALLCSEIKSCDQTEFVGALKLPVQII